MITLTREPYVRIGFFGIGLETYWSQFRALVDHWNAQAPAHHWAIGVGHIGAKLEKLAALLQIEMVQVC